MNLKTVTNTITQDKTSVFRWVVYSFIFSGMYTSHIIFDYSFHSWSPVGIFHVLPGPLSRETMDFLSILWPITGIFCLLGFMINLMSKLCFALSLFVLGYAYNFNTVFHTSHVYVMVLGIMALMPLRSKFSLDSLIFKKPQFFYLLSADFGIKTIKLYIVYTWTLLGLQKLIHSGPEWVFSSNFSNMIFLTPGTSQFGEFFYRELPWTLPIVAGFGLVLELVSPLALFSRIAGYIFPLFWTLFHFLVHAYFGGHSGFYSQIPLYLCFWLFPDINFKPLLKRYVYARV